MAVWFEVEKTDSGIRDFLDCLLNFHEYKIDKVKYDSDIFNAEVFFKYDSLGGSIILRFLKVPYMNVAVTTHSGLAQEINGVVLLLLDNGNFLWIDDDRFGDKSSEHIEELKSDSSWIEAERIIWAVTDENGNPSEMPDYFINQTFDTYGKKESRHFDLKPYAE